MQVQYQYDFEKLPGGVRNQLRKSIGNNAYLIYGETRSNFALYFLNGLLALFCGFLLYASATANFGDPLRDTLWSTPGSMIWYAILLFGIVHALVAIRKRMVLNKKFRFLPGRYVFPFALVDARANKVSIFDLTQMRKLDAIHHSTNGAYSKTVFQFKMNDGLSQTITIQNRSQAELMLSNFNLAQEAARKAFDERDVPALYGFDPVLDLRKAKWPGASQQDTAWLKNAGKTLAASTMPLVLVSAVVLAALFWYARNAAADGTAYENARQLKTEAAYLAYIEHGKFHVKEMQAALPRVVFDEVRQKRSVSLLRDLKKRFPGADIQADIPLEIHALYQKAWQKFQLQAVSTDSHLVTSMEQLLRFAEEHDNPQVAIKFTRPTADDLSQLDAFLKSKEARLNGAKMIMAAKYFADDSASVREARIIEGLRSAFSSIFPNDVLAFSVANVRKNGVQVVQPMLDIAYRIEPSGSIYSSEKNNDAFVGLVMRFHAAIMVPEVEEHWKFDLEVEPPQTFRVEYKTATPNALSRPSDSQVYAVMAERAFDQLASKITAAFFRADSAIYLKQMKRQR